MVKQNLESAVIAYEELKEQPKLFKEITEQVTNLEDSIEDIRHVIALLRQQQINKDNVIPQDDSYMSLPEFELDKYKQQKKYWLCLIRL